MKASRLTILIPLAPLACGPDANDATRLHTITRDSADSRIIENPRPPEGSRVWRVGPEPAVSIGEREGEDPYMLHQVRDATKLDDGRILVANGGDNELRVFDAFGTWLETWGGTGEGPGEFGDLSHVDTWPGDSIIAWHGPRRGISVFDSEGNFGRGFALEIDADDPFGLYVFPAAVTAAGSILAGQLPDVFDRVVVELRDADGRVLSSLGRHPGVERHRVETVSGSERMMMMYETIFGPAVAQVPWGDLVVHTLGDRYEIKAFAEDGKLARIVRREHASRPPTAAEIEAYIEEQVSGYPDELVAEQRRRYRSVPVAERMPAFTSVFVDRLHHLWVEEYELPGEERPGSLWTVFDPEGRVLGFVETPEGLEILEIGEDYILGRWLDELGVEHVRVWPLER